MRSHQSRDTNSNLHRPQALAVRLNGGLYEVERYRARVHGRPLVTREHEPVLLLLQIYIHFGSETQQCNLLRPLSTQTSAG